MEDAEMQAQPIARSRCGEGRRRIAFLSSALMLAALTVPLHAANAADAQAARGKYLVGLMSCTDCHTPGHFLGKEDRTRFLAGSDVGFAIPGLGVFVGPNLTPDKDTGLGNWTPAQIATALTKGQTPDGRILAPPMPWRNYAGITKADALAIAAYLKSLPPVSHQVPGPFGPSETPTTFVMTVQPGDVYARLVNPPPPAPPPPAPPAASAPPPGPSATPPPESK
jgi:mono/diheme cytochrome c family protein